MNFLLSAISGILTSLSMPGMVCGFLVWFSLVPLLVAISKEKPLKAGLNSMLFFFVHLILTHFWLFNTLTRNMPLVLKRYPPHLGFFVFILFGLYESVFMFPLGFSMALFRIRGFGGALLFASSYTLLEKLREIGDMGYTGGRLSDALYSYTALLQLSKITGELGLVFSIALINYLIFESIDRKGWKKSIVYISVPLLMNQILKPLIPTPELINPVEIQVHQTSYDPASKYSAPIGEKLESINPEKNLVYVLPESYFVRRIDGVEKKLMEIARERKSMLVIGALDISEKLHNSVFYFIPDGSVQRYDKIKLFPFVEFLPYPRIFSFLRFLKGLNYYEPGKSHKVVDWKGVGIGSQICFESYFESVSRNLVKNGAQILLVLTNDGWFESEVALKQHFAKAIFRAVENGRWIVQVANKGITGVVDGFGNVIYTLQIGVEKKATFLVQPRSTTTFYTKHPNFMIFLSFILLGVSIFMKIFPL